MVGDVVRGLPFIGDTVMFLDDDDVLIQAEVTGIRDQGGISVVLVQTGAKDRWWAYPDVVERRLPDRASLTDLERWLAE